MDFGNLLIAASGCTHGNLDQLYTQLAIDEARIGKKCDLLLCTGDFQAMRDRADLEVLACPPKYRVMGDFWKYYVGMTEAPVLTVFVGGNHEAVGFMQELKLGGWAAPNIFYLGDAGVLKIGSLRIAGVSGIYRPSDYEKREVSLPFTERKMKEAYAVKSSSIARLSKLQSPVDIFLSHDWPLGVTRLGNADDLFRKKPWLRKDAGRMGNPYTEEIARRLNPRYWLASHMHVRWDAEIGPIHFRAMDKCLPGRSFLSYIRDVQGSISAPLLDREWASILTGQETSSDIPYPSFGMIDLSLSFSYLTSPYWRLNPQELSF